MSLFQISIIIALWSLIGVIGGILLGSLLDLENKSMSPIMSKLVFFLLGPMIWILFTVLKFSKKE